MSSVEPQYVLVPNPALKGLKDSKSANAVKDEKIQTSGAAKSGVQMGVSIPLLKKVMASKGRAGGKLKAPVYTYIVGTYTSSSAANTALATSTVQSPVGAQDWAGYAALYDECRVVSVKIHVNADCTQNVQNSAVTWGCAFDPINPAAYANIADVITARYKFAPLAFPGTLDVTSQTPAPMNATGFYTKSFKLHPGRVTVDSATAIGGGWFGTSATSNDVIGYFKCYCPALGAGVVCNVSWYTEYECEFRDRT
jgi:hypothetical protein